MKTPLSGCPLRKRIFQAFTLPEMLIVMTIFTLLVTALVSSQIFGLRMYKISATKLAATADGRRALNEVRERVREAKIVVVGNGDNVSFFAAADNQPQIGNALQVFPTTNLAVYTVFYIKSNSLNSFVKGGGAPHVIAHFVTNTIAFQAEDFEGIVLTNANNNRVIRMSLEFYQWEYPIATIGQGGLYDYYRLQTRVTRRLIE